MEITRIGPAWPEKKDFSFLSTDTAGECVFIHFHTPVILHTENGDSPTKEGAVIVYDRYHTRSFSANGTPLLHDWVHIRQDLSDLMQICGLKFGEIYYPQNRIFITEILQEAELEKMHGGMFSQQITEGLIRELFFKISREIQESRPEPITPELKTLLTDARREIHQSYNRRWEIEQMAGLVHLSPPYFYKVYKKAFGISPKKDLQNIRMEHAKTLLAQEKYSVKEVAEQIGYENEYYFIRKFKEATGITPGKYK